MTIEEYQNEIYYHFFNKVQEVDFFLNLCINNYIEYSEQNLPKNIKFLYNFQYLFSAFLNSLSSVWEISRLSCELANEKIISETQLEKSFNIFSEFFELKDEETYNLFIFMKHARNASAHDGTITLNSGMGDKFYFGNSLKRYKKYKDSFSFINIKSPSEDAITILIKMAYFLVPIFKNKLMNKNYKVVKKYEVPELDIPESIKIMMKKSFLEDYDNIEKKLEKTRNLKYENTLSRWKNLLY